MRHDPLTRRTFLRLSSTLALGVAAAPFGAFARSAARIERSAFVMGSIVTATAYGETRLCEAAIGDAFRAMKEVDAAMSVYRPSSALSALNRRAGDGPVAAPAELVALLDAARGYAAATGGAFDPTVKPLLELYGFLDAPHPARIPSDREIAALLDGVGAARLAVDTARSTVAYASARTQVDLGGIAVGHALDRAGAILRRGGVTSALLNHSGDLLAIGAPPDDDAWEIGITDPRRPARVATTLRIRDEALATSGNYRNVRTIAGRLFGHILDPAAGRPAEASLSSTVVAPSATAADALSTGTFVLGPSLGADALAAGGGTRLVAIVAGERPGTTTIITKSSHATLPLRR